MTESTFFSFKLSPELQAVLRRWLNFHRLLWILTLVMFVVAWNRGLALLYGLFSLMAAALMISHLMPRWQLRNIRVTRSTAGDFTAGRPGAMVYRLEAGGARYHVEVADRLEFAVEKEQRGFFSKLAGRALWQCRFTCLQRGCYPLGDCRLTCAYPFGVFSVVRQVKTEPMEILVLPKVIDLARLPLPFAADATTWGEAPVPQKGGRDEVAFVREYIRGDEPGRIHWPVSARHQNLVVKVYEKTDRPAMLVVLDCRATFNVGDGPVSTFEYAVTLAASMIRHATRQGLACYLVARDTQPRELMVNAFSTDLYRLYETLARLTCTGRHPYTRVVEQAQRRFPQANLIATFRLDRDTARPALGPSKTQIDLKMDTQSFLHPAQPSVRSDRRRRGHRFIYRVHANQDLGTLF